jgi:hypothetical protein
MFAAQEAEKAQLKQQQAAFVTEIEQWSQGEVAAIEAAAAAKLQQQQEETAAW